MGHSMANMVDLEPFLKSWKFYTFLKFYLIHLKINLQAELLALLKSLLIKLDFSTDLEQHISQPPFCFFMSPQSLQVYFILLSLGGEQGKCQSDEIERFKNKCFKNAKTFGILKSLFFTYM